MIKSGMVSIVGRPNVGKSTLLNRLLNKKIAITSDKAGTTRNIILGVYNDEDSQMVFVDTPGIHKPINKLGNILNKKAYLMTSDVDLILFMVDISTGFGKGDKFVLEKLKEENRPVILLLNKVDKMDKEELIKKIAELAELYPFKEIIPISAMKDINIKELIKTLKKYMPNEGKYYDDDFVTNQPKSLIITERVREKVLHLTKDEIPYSVTCVLETYDETKDKIVCGVLIIVDRDNIKKIIIGKGGSMIKEIGTKARLDLEEYYGKKVYLELFVKTIEDWRNKELKLQELGLKDDLDE